MPVDKLNPYLMFNGNAAKAIELYESALGAKTTARQRFDEVPDLPVKEGQGDKIIHAMLEIGGGTIMISDTMPETKVTPGSNVEVCLNYTDVESMTKAFNALSVGGKVDMPLADTFWGARFGSLVDAFGVSWMFNCQLDGKG